MTTMPPRGNIKSSLTNVESRSQHWTSSIFLLRFLEPKIY